MLIQSSKLLRVGGRLIMLSADFGDYDPENLTSTETFISLMKKHDFGPVLEIHKIMDFMNPDVRRQGVQVTWYAEKLK